MILSYLNICWVALFLAEFVLVKFRLNPARILGILLFMMSKMLIPLWDFSKFSQGSGITTYLEFPRTGDFEACLVISALALQISSIIYFLKFSGSRLNLREAIKGIGIKANTYSALLLVLWALGQGTSIFARNGYLQSNGELVLLRPLAFLAPLLAAFFYALSMVRADKNRSAAHLLAGVWFLLLLGIGSRSALIFLVIALIVVGLKLFQAKIPGFKPLLLGLEIYVGTYLLLVAFSVTLFARLNPHGLFRIPQMLTHPTVPTFWPNESWLETLSSFLISISSSYPIISLSIHSVVPAALLITNANPLPTEFLGIAPNNSAEFILPWLPKAVLGELYGAFGPYGTFFWILGMSLIALFFYGRAASRGQSLLALAIGVIFVATILLALQYPTRVVFRIYSLTYLLPVANAVWRSLIKSGKQSKIAYPKGISG